jgi:hypothetical protein
MHSLSSQNVDEEGEIQYNNMLNVNCLCVVGSNKLPHIHIRGHRVLFAAVVAAGDIPCQGGGPSRKHSANKQELIIRTRLLKVDELN